MGVEHGAYKPHPVKNSFVKFQVFMGMTMKNMVFWDVAPCGFSKTSVQTRAPQCYIPEDNILRK
jgi:hypothetical protein